jgi:acylphosphatase
MSLMAIAARPELNSYSTENTGGALATVRMNIAGRFDASYADFIGERAVWLSLSGWVSNIAPGRAEVIAAGPEVLVGALEMACMLGPLDALIETLEIEAVDRQVPPGFAVRA